MSGRVTLADLEVGMTSSHHELLDRRTVAEYARLTGDHNPVHEDEAYVSGTRFGRPIAHGLLVASYVQTALTALVAPGGVSVEYRLALRAPVPVDTAITARATCSRLDPDRGRAVFTIAVVLDPDATVAVTGEAVIAFPREEAS